MLIAANLLGTKNHVRRFLEDMRVPAGEWLLHNGASSVLGRELVCMAQRRGTKLINVVRRREAVNELKDLGCASLSRCVTLHARGCRAPMSSMPFMGRTARVMHVGHMLRVVVYRLLQRAVQLVVPQCCSADSDIYKLSPLFDSKLVSCAERTR